jgi:signal transduction histidine kinase
VTPNAVTPDNRRRDRGFVEDALERLYERIGSRVVVVSIVLGFGLLLLTCAVIASLAQRYLQTSADKVVICVAIGLPLLLTGGMTGLYTARDILRTQLAWRGAQRTAANAAQAWEATARGPAEVVRRAFAGLGIVLAPFAAVCTAIIGERPWVVIPIGVTFYVAVAAAWVLVRFGAELILRPMVRDIARHLPQNFEPHAGDWRLRTKALAPLPFVAMLSTMICAGLVDLVAKGPGRLSFALALALGTAAVTAAIFFIVTRSVLDPLDDLLTATRRVRAGDIATTVPVVSADDLGELAHSFNGMLTELRRNAEELQASRARVVAAADEERRRAERDLHDGAQQQLVLLGLKLAAAERLVARDPHAAAAAIAELRGDLQEAIAQLREFARGIYPAVLESEGLTAALGQAVERAAIAATITSDGARRYPAELESAVYFCCLEALQNAAKHAGERARAEVRLAERDGELVFEVADDGRGFDATGHAAESSGLQNMMDRVGALGGRLTIASAPGEGTTVTGTIPLDHAAPASF